MMKSATAVKAKIKNKAGGSSDKSQIMLRIYLMERLLERVSLSRYRDNFVLKGGLLVSSLVGVDMRSTMDVDTTVKSLPLNKSAIQKILEEIMAIGDGNNDIEMFEYANYSVSMENGTELAKKAAKYQTDSNENDGVAKAIRKYALNNSN